VTAIRFQHVSKRYENGALAVDDLYVAESE
jgi:hypothetical protein